MEDVIRGTLSCGFDFEIPKERFSSYVTLKMLKAADKDNSKILDVIPRILDEKQETELIEKLGGDPSFVDICKALDEIFKIVGKETDTKKSSPLPN